MLKRKEAFRAIETPIPAGPVHLFFEMEIMAPRKNISYRFILLGILIFAISLRVVYLWEISDTPSFSALLGDAESYDIQAQTIQKGNWLGDHVFYQAPFYVYFLGAVYTIFGRNFLIVRLVQILFGAMSCVLIAEAGRTFFSKRVGIASGILLAIYPTAIYFDGLIQKAVFSLFFMALLVFLLSKISHQSKVVWWLLTGITLGCFGLSRENSLILILVILIWLLVYFRHEPWKKQLIWSASLFLGLAIILIPVTIRNKIVGDEFVLTTYNFGPNFYIGNSEISTGTYTPLHNGRGTWREEQKDATMLAEAALGRKISSMEVSQYWTDQALTYIKSNFGQWLLLTWKKWLLTWNTVELSDTESQYLHCKWSFLLNGLSLLLHFGIICPIAVLGICITSHHRNKIWILYFILGSYAVSVTIFFVFARFRFPLVAILVLFAAACLMEIISFFKKHKTKTLIYCAIALVAFILTNWKIIPKEIILSGSTRNIGSHFADKGDVTSALRYYQESLQIYPNNKFTHQNLGVLLQKEKRYDEALFHFREVIRIDPFQEKVHQRIVDILCHQGQIDKAIDHLSFYLKIKPDNADTHNRLGVLFSRQGKMEEGVKHLNRAIQLMPTYVQAYNNLGNLYAMQKKYKEAIRYYDEALKINPGYSISYQNRKRISQLIKVSDRNKIGPGLE